MLVSVLESGVALIIATAGAIYVMGQIHALTKHNKEEIEAIKSMLSRYQEDMRDMIEKNMEDTKTLLDTNKKHQEDALSREITYVKELIALSSKDVKEDIKRLEKEQRKNEDLKMKVAILSQSVKSLHRRLDVEPPFVLDETEENSEK